jgi:hypothetical protein
LRKVAWKRSYGGYRYIAIYANLKIKKKNVGELILDISKSQLASILGTIPETLTRILLKMTRENLIDQMAIESF